MASELCPNKVSIRPRGPLMAEVRVPGSKSLTNRAMLMAALADGISELHGALLADDSRAMASALRALGFDVRMDADARVCRVAGRGGAIPAAEADLNVGDAGTAMRFLAAFTALGRGRYRLDGSRRMRERPIGDLIEALAGIGVRARCELGNGCPPVLVEADGLPGGRVRVEGSKSSQYVSALLMVAPYAARPMEIEVTGSFVSKPFAEMTIGLMENFGMRVEREEERLFRPIHGARYVAGTYEIEGDATAATYFWAAAAICGGSVTVSNVRRGSLQGDAAFPGVLREMGCRVEETNAGITVTRARGEHLRGVDVDLNDMPDTVQTLAAVALFAEGPTRIRNVGNLRIKETDRIAALAAELTRLGARVTEESDGLTIEPPSSGPLPARIRTYGDHRMAMAMALVGLRAPGIEIMDPGCVAKTFPEFFRELGRLGCPEGNAV
ncbi:MAG: 3-phosphoshikimate 1-carboxyvinyltransferase [Planctomycetota bacterium]|nr:3-phosphoshikimate 1-carboxyvinyltransferase [Planctomycetota bacterium]